MVTCYIGLGANLNNPEQQIVTALQALQQLPDTELTAVSALYGSKPLGPQDQPDYLNAVAQLQTSLEPLALLDALQAQELAQGRERKRHWGERNIDLDIILYGDLQLRSERLNLPHHEMHKRSFVLLPLAELTPQLVLPDGQAISDITPEFDGQLQRLKSLVSSL
ncbi:2-amino-4-hydroxy-6-hydroxymethyldihydropteridine diphosphokinase [Bacterioplanoides sp. SCSIO 12839]|uniref:2-amino-4-hydroxy-6- hydroxymethyldihydropteridine diphosphokinase n=1 Tax=Bacterioplanoides sp. SCSIO 12839 TaxID=2829569 RepID=UPI0021062C94|nr:2-amino-4-hydroxy-6-hydroxymethyldihydropteridine diphosphokinase [Bacterioplanoides sp. SCSIO 12839]UTW48793.1 2-amino-4-hydroxy-6-hydroxymethyldihydropteridine diphosphokinase [Bacterioplanoides sp. SCSIO 12839]